MVLSLSSTIVDAARADGFGMIIVNAFGGTPPYSYLWSTGATGNTITAKAGTYTVTASDFRKNVSSVLVIQEPTQFDPDNSPPDSGLLADAACRDMYCRNMSSDQATYSGVAGSSLIKFATELPGTKQTTPVGEFSLGDGALKLDMALSAEGARKTMMQVTKDGVTFFGNMTVVGDSTDITMQSLVLADKTIKLGENLTTAQQISGAGMILGEGTRSFLYSTALDAMVFDGALVAGQSYLGPHAFSVDNGNGASIVMDVDGLHLSGISQMAFTGLNYYPTDAGYYHAPSDTYITNAGGTWSMEKAAFTEIRTSTATVDSSLDIPDTGYIYFSNKMWRIGVDVNDEYSLNIERYDADSDTYISKLMLD